MKTYLALTALLYSLAAAVDLLDDDLLDNDDMLNDDDLFGDDELSDDETSARTISDSLSYNGFKYTFHDKKKNWSTA